jgi:hypothetical protein
MNVNDQMISPGKISTQIGFYSALLIAIAFAIFTFCFIAITATPPLFMWTNLSDFVVYARQHSQLLQDVARFTMLLFGPLYVILLNSIYEHTPPGKKILARIGIDFGLAFSVLTGINYFVQLSAVRLSLLKGELQGLEQMVQANPISGISAIGMLGWTLFLGLSSLFIAAVFSGSKLEKAIRITFLVNGICCLLGGIGYVFDLIGLIFGTIDLGMGSAVLTAAILLCVFFKKAMAIY